MNTQQKTPVGGWLIVLIIGLFYSAYSFAKVALSSIQYLSTGGAEKLSALPGYVGEIKVEIMFEIALFAFAACLIVLFFRRSRSFPNLLIAFVIANVIFFAFHIWTLVSASYPNSGVGQLLQAQVHSGYIELVISIVVAALWSAYMKMSGRVRQVFVA